MGGLSHIAGVDPLQQACDEALLERLYRRDK